MRIDEYGNKAEPLHLARRALKRLRNQSPNLDDLFYALDDSARRAIIERLSCAPLSVSDIARSLPMAVAPALRHLQVLEAAGLIRSQKVGRVRTCAVQPDALSLIQQWINARHIEHQHLPDPPGEYLETVGNEARDDEPSD